MNPLPRQLISRLSLADQNTVADWNGDYIIYQISHPEIFPPEIPKDLDRHFHIGGVQIIDGHALASHSRNRFTETVAPASLIGFGILLQ